MHKMAAVEEKLEVQVNKNVLATMVWEYGEDRRGAKTIED